MTIPGRGDLAPRRRSSFGRRQRRWPRVLLTLLVVAALGFGGYAGWQRWHDNDTDSVASGSPCPTPTASASAIPPSAHVTAKVLNGSLKAGLAKRVAKTLRQRFGVVVAKVGNARRFTRGVSIVRYPGRQGAPARVLAGYVLPHARLKQDKHAKKLELDIGTRFRAVAPRPRTPAPTPSGSPSRCS
jgi:hypothetical protein